MAQYSKQLDVAAPPAAVYSYLAELTHAADWDPAIVEATPDGDAVRLVHAFYGRRFTLAYRLVQAEPDRRLVFAGDDKKMASQLEFGLVAGEGGHTELTYTATLSLRGALRLFDKGLQVAYEHAGDRAADGLAGRLDELSRRG